MDDNELNLEPIEERLKAATPGPWFEIFEGEEGIVIDLGKEPNGDFIRTYATDSDKKLMAHSWQDMAVLVAEVKRLRGIVENIRISLVPVNLFDDKEK